MSSLLTSLIRAGTQFQQALEKRSTRTDTPADTRQATADAAVETDPASAGDDRFTPTARAHRIHSARRYSGWPWPTTSRPWGKMLPLSGTRCGTNLPNTTCTRPPP